MHTPIQNQPRYRRLRIFSTLAGILWALPWSLFGLALALPIRLSGGRFYRVAGTVPALLVRGPLAERLLTRHPFGPMIAMAIGHVIIARHDLTPRTLAHELAHVRQSAHWGPVFPFAYLAASAWALLHGHQAYWHNHFEIAARKAEQHGARL